MTSDAPAPLASRSTRLHQLALKLVVLIVIATAAFVLTREAAAHARRAAVRDAADFHTNGVRALAAGHVDEAVTDLRRAVTKDRDNPRYALSLANALVSQGQLDGADRTLTGLRAATPDDPEVNLALARLAVRRHDSDAAIRYYRSALYAPWRVPDQARGVRMELVEFLLGRDDRTRAVAELVAARATTPDQPAAHATLGSLFLRADEPRLALEEFRTALRLAPGDGIALAGAGRAAFAIGDYPAAVRYLEGADSRDAEVNDMRTVAAFVVRGDPLAPRLRAADRLSRAQASLDYIRDRLETCERPATALAGDLDALQRSLQRSGGRDTELLERAVDTAAAGADVVQMCGVAVTPRDRALAIIARQHGAGTP